MNNAFIKRGFSIISFRKYFIFSFIGIIIINNFIYAQKNFYQQINSKKESLSKAGSYLSQLYTEYTAYPNRTTINSFLSKNPLLKISDNKVIVDIVAIGKTEALAPKLRELGMDIKGIAEPVISGFIPINSIKTIADLEDVRFFRPAMSISNIGLTTSQGDISMHSNDVRNSNGVNGSGVIVGVLSDSYNFLGGAQEDILSGDLPGTDNPNGFMTPVNVLTDDNSTDEGRGMLQIIHDIAPGATLSFATANGGQAAFANNIRNLRTAGADIIVDDVQYYGEPMFQDGIIAQAVDEVVATGVAYFSSAGNQARKSYESIWRSGIERLNGWISEFRGGTTHDFDPSEGIDDMQSFTLNNNETIKIVLQWDSPFASVCAECPGSQNDLDIYILNSAGNEVLASALDPNINADAYEILTYQNKTGSTTLFNLMIVNHQGNNPGFIKYVNFGNTQFNLEHATNSSTLYGHANANGAEAVGAAYYNNTPAFGVEPPLLEDFSSPGSTAIRFNTTGQTTSDSRIEKPEITAPDGVNTTFFGALDSDGDGFRNFFGTSAAAPHAAAVAALLLDANSSFSPEQIYSILEQNTIDIGMPGFDNNSGFGLIQANMIFEHAEIQQIIPNNLIQEQTGRVDVVVTINRGGAYYVKLSDDYLLNNWDWTYDATDPVSLLAGSHTFSFYTTPHSGGEYFQFWLYEDIASNGTFTNIDRKTVLLSASTHQLTLNSPNGGEVFYANSSMNIEWTSFNIENVKIELTTDNGLNWSTIIPSTPASTGSFAWGWGVPNTSSDLCKIKISDASNSEFFDLSDDFFSIINPTITITTPNGGENWSVNSTKNIQWSSSDVDNIKIEYSTNNGTNWSTVIESYSASAGTYSWLVPNALSGSCKIRISDINSSEYDISDNTFCISEQLYWSSDPNVNNPICTAQYSQQSPRITSDGNGGAIIAWADCRSANWSEIYAQRIKNNGVIDWTINGVCIQNASELGAAATGNIAIVNDAEGGAIISWGENRNSEGWPSGWYNNLYAQKITSNGTVSWQENGVDVCTAGGDQTNIIMISDGNGGAIITWTDTRNGNQDIYAQKINSSGLACWGVNGVTICNAENNQYHPVIISDGSRGAIITWVDNRNSSDNIYSQRINSDGIVQWTPNGVAVTVTNNDIYELYPQTTSDANGGAIITWKDNRNGSIDVYAQRINSNGIIQWTSNGVLICSSTVHWGLSNPIISSDGSGGAIINWMDTRGSGYALYAQRINMNGNVLWATNGIIVNNQYPIEGPNCVSDNNGGVIITWSYRTGLPGNYNWYIRGQKIDLNGITKWSEGINICTATGSQGFALIISDGSGGIIATWGDARNETVYADIYAAKINANGILGGEPVALPVELSTFTVTLADNKVKLNWKTETEVNNYGFEIERKSELNDWMKIGFVQGYGNANSQKDYSFLDNPQTGKYFYRLKQIDTDGKYEYSKVIEISIIAPATFELSQNYPNPFNPSTKIKYQIAKQNQVHLVIYDVLGREVATLVDEVKDAGSYEVEFAGSTLSSGVYIYKIKAGDFSDTKKFVLMK